MRSRTEVINGTPTRWEEDGDGIPVVLVHGIPTSPDLWRKVTPLVPNARKLCFEMIGYGDSIAAGAEREISVARQADYLLDWLDALQVERAILVGHDLGGGVVQIAAVRRASLAAGILLTNAIGYDSWPIPSVKMMRAIGGLVRHLPAGVVKAMVAPLFVRGHDDQDVARESFRIHWSRYERDRAGVALIRQMRSLDVNDTLSVADDLPRLRGTPSRLIWGAADPFQPVKYGERFAHDLDAPLERIEGGKHFTPEDHPDIIARGINDLVEANR
ncbi:MAG: alpha/beta hydrolase [Acidobacteria bacterium]|nr:alpha/beta hydrolase [Acidobacteriota bacterium]